MEYGKYLQALFYKINLILTNLLFLKQPVCANKQTSLSE